VEEGGWQVKVRTSVVQLLPPAHMPCFTGRSSALQLVSGDIKSRACHQFGRQLEGNTNRRAVKSSYRTVLSPDH
jgi:hypothetical protein